jgi:hypothetical protein
MFLTEKADPKYAWLTIDRFLPMSNNFAKVDMPDPYLLKPRIDKEDPI